MKISFVTSTLTSGGAERVISILANEFSKRGYDVEMIALTSISPDFYTLDENVRFLHADKECGGGLLKEILWFRKHVKKEHPDVVIAFMEAVYEFVLMALLGTGTPVVSSERKSPDAAFSFTRRFLRWLLLPTAAAHVVQTQKIKSFYRKQIQEKTHIIYNPVNEIVFSERMKTFEHDENRIVSVGRLYPQKNHKLMIEAFSQLANDFPHWKLVIFGEGFLRPELEALIELKGLKHRVLLPGLSSNVIEEVAKSKVFCLSSDYEGMSNAMIEAMCVGTPIVTTRVSGADELLVNNVTGLLVDIGDMKQLCVALRRLMSDSELRNKLSQQAKKKASYFKTDQIVSDWEELIIKVVNEKKKVSV